MDRPATGIGLDMPIMHDSDRYDFVRNIGSGNFGVARLMRDKQTQELVAVKYIERGEKVCVNSSSLSEEGVGCARLMFFLSFTVLQIDQNVKREIINHRSLRHPNIIGFKEVILTPTHLAIVMEFASGGELFARICNAGRFTEDEARFFFQQLISGVSHCHAMEVCHRDLKLENTLLDGSPALHLKICDFGYSKVKRWNDRLEFRLEFRKGLGWFMPQRVVDKVEVFEAKVATFEDSSSMLHSQPNSTVGTPAYIAPEVLLKKEYDGKVADVWSCGVTLYVMLVGSYPFEDPTDPRNSWKTIQRVLGVQYSIPDDTKISPECGHLISRIFVFDPAERITIREILKNEWFLKNLPPYLTDENIMGKQFVESDQPMQSIDTIMQIISEATVPAAGTYSLDQFLTDDIIDDNTDESDSDFEQYVDSSGEIVYAM
ncbi:hypothetical protein V8G54_015009 [Vigna mungo]|uniref:non-specific serine/threonine protein kinase n=1 Tax=Vigna mungo TaxID=3915 RepID=A0AAQ3RWG8_VIGMU